MYSFYVSNNLGNDTTGDGSFKFPYKTIHFAIEKCPNRIPTKIMIHDLSYDDKFIDVNILNNKIIDFVVLNDPYELSRMINELFTWRFESFFNAKNPTLFFIFSNQYIINYFKIVASANIAFINYNDNFFENRSYIRVNKGYILYMNYNDPRNKNVYISKSDHNVITNNNLDVICDGVAVIDTTQNEILPTYNITKNFEYNDLYIISQTNGIQQQPFFNLLESGNITGHNTYMTSDTNIGLINKISENSTVNIQNGQTTITYIDPINNHPIENKNVNLIYTDNTNNTNNKIQLFNNIVTVNNLMKNRNNIYLTNTSEFSMSTNCGLNNVYINQKESISVYNSIYNKNGFIINGSINYGYIDITENYQYVNKDGRMFFINAKNNDIIIKLPDQSNGRKISYIRIDISLNNVEIHPPLGEYINGQNKFKLNKKCEDKYPSITIINTGKNWFITV